MRIATLVAVLMIAVLMIEGTLAAREPIPEKMVVLTFDDAVKSHYTVVRPILKQYGFGATFFVSEGFDFTTNKTDYLTWKEVTQLHRDGFEIGNHTRDHMAATADNLPQLKEQLDAINARCREHGIPKPISFAYAGNGFDVGALPILQASGIQFARRGGQPERPYEPGRGFAYQPPLDHPLLIPSAGDARPDWTLDDFCQAVDQARHGRIAVLQFHGVPDKAHSWVNTPVEKFKQYMQYLAENGYRVIALRDLARYVDPQIAPLNPTGVIENRKRSLELGISLENFRRPKDEADLRYWLENMVWHHRFSPVESSAATGLTTDEITAALTRLDIRPDNRPTRPADGPLLVVPYPGGRHPRIGFHDGAIRPQRETKCSVFTPWDESSYLVVDIPEAIWHNTPQGRQLLYLAHTHVPATWTIWDRKGVQLKKQEWQRGADGTLLLKRTLPNGVEFGTKVIPGSDAVRMDMWLTNGTDKKLTGLIVQNCIMLKGAAGFDSLTSENKQDLHPYSVCRSAEGNRWIITAWVPCHGVWANEHCPCMHSDPVFADCPPGETTRLRGWLSFYEGTDIKGELKRIEATGWRE